jgi:uncharacterized membrane protein YphA (DoxX/SURF4 family)
VERLTATEAPAAVLVIRLLTGGVFGVEGLKKFLFVAEWGERAASPTSDPLPVGAGELVDGIPILVRPFTRAAALLLLVGRGDRHHEDPDPPRGGSSPWRTRRGPLREC